MFTTVIAIIIVVTTVAAEGQVSLLGRLEYMASHNQVYGQLHAPLALGKIIGSSLDIAVQSCQSSFRWDRWNCPNSDFLLRRTSKSPLMDREDAYVNAITTAAVLYTITKNCSSGIIAGCVSCSDNPYTSQCSDDPVAADKLFRTHVNADFANDFYGKISRHNYRTVTNLLAKSLIKQCVCSFMSPNGICLNEMCLHILKPFEDIAQDIRQMYDEGLQLANTHDISRIMWDNIPLDSLVYIKDSPNYCEPDAVAHWNGMRGRQCTTGEHAETSMEHGQHCRHLCRECGYTVRSQSVVVETRCNCKFTWGFQIQCEQCVTVQRQYYCY